MVPMHAIHILLGRPWKFDKKITHDEFKNKYTIIKDGITITFIPFTPKQIYDGQIKLKKKEHNDIDRKN